jgi:hypothetical protein
MRGFSTSLSLPLLILCVCRRRRRRRRRPKHLHPIRHKAVDVVQELALGAAPGAAQGAGCCRGLETGRVVRAGGGGVAGRVGVGWRAGSGVGWRAGSAGSGMGWWAGSGVGSGQGGGGMVVQVTVGDGWGQLDERPCERFSEYVRSLRRGALRCEHSKRREIVAKKRWGLVKKKGSLKKTRVVAKK